MRSSRPHEICSRGAYRGAPTLVITCENTVADTLELIRASRNNNTHFVVLDGPRSWDGEFCSEVARAMAGHELTEDITFRLERGIFSPDWPYATESMYISMDCSVLFDGILGPAAEFQEKLTDEIGVLPEIDELLVSISPSTMPLLSYQHLDMLATELCVGQLFVDRHDGNIKELTKVISKCTTPWRIG